MGAIRWIREVVFADAAWAGGKAAALGELARAGFRVPDGFVVPASGCEHEALDAFRALGSPLVAVRSSAASEDGRTASWAGQFETFLGVDGAGLLDAIARCRASGGGKRAAAYGGGAPQRVAVVVQAMVPADAAGVAFSVDPVSGARRVVIEAVRGLGDALVSGRVHPDPDAIGVAQTEEIVETVRRIESCFGYPVDVEWAIADGVLYVLQARPITTL